MTEQAAGATKVGYKRVWLYAMLFASLLTFLGKYMLYCFSTYLYLLGKYILLKRKHLVYRNLHYDFF